MPDTSTATLGERVADLMTLPEDERDTALRDLLRTEVHDPVMRMTVDADGPRHDDLAELAKIVRETVPEGVEDRLYERIRVFVRLLRLGALEPAWTLAHDNASGVVRPTRAESMWAGGSFLNTRLPLPTHVEDGTVFAWLPGFRDPRYGVPDDVYSIDHEVVQRGELDHVLLDGGTLRLFGTAWLALLETGPDDVITVAFSGPDGAAHRATGRRARRPDYVKTSGPELTRLAWCGWAADVDLRPLTAGTWRVSLELTQQGVHRARRIGRGRTALAEPALVEGIAHEVAGHALRLDSEKDGALLVRVARLGLTARAVPQPARRALRRVRPRETPGSNAPQ